MTETTSSMTDAQKLRKAYGRATTVLRENHREEFNILQQEAAHELGLTWKPKPSEAEKAKADLHALLTEHPELLDEVAELATTRKGAPSE